MIKFLNKKSLSFTLTSKFGLGRQKQASFTLIELLVVIAIIGILATIVLVSLSNARTKARDARRETDMHQFSVAMEMYYDANSATYPDLPDDVATAIPAGANNLAPYMAPAALDPSNPAQQYFWSDCTDVTHQQYCVWATLENPSAPTTYCIANPKGTKETTIAPSCSAAPKCYDL